MQSTLGKSFVLIIAAFGLAALHICRVDACCPSPAEMAFISEYHPDPPLEGFLGGRLGILRPAYSPYYLYVAYRQLNSTNLVKDQRILLGLWEEKTETCSTPRDIYHTNWESEWLNARMKVPGNERLYSITNHRKIGKEEYHYQWYTTCYEDAFLSAARTLGARISRFGAGSREVKQWLLAQNLVFTNCGGGKSIPADAPGDIDPLIKQDRAYQIASAHFYSEDFDTAEKLFREIASDRKSPWREMAAYLATRTLVRKASLEGGEGKDNLTILARAEVELRRILEDNQLEKVHSASAKLLELVRQRMNPEQRLLELAKSALTAEPNAESARKVDDYIYLLERVKAGNPDDMTDWICSFRQRDFDHSLRKWKETGFLHWLISALGSVRAGHAEASNLLMETGKISPDSLVYPTAAYCRIRLLVDSGREDDARSELDSILSNDRAKLPPSSLNLFLALRMKLARGFEEFLAHAKRVPAGIAYEGKVVAEIRPEDEKLFPKQLEFFDKDSAGILNRQMPLRLLARAAKGDSLPRHLRKQIAIAGWVRGELLERREIARELATLLCDLAPELKTDLSAYLSEKNSRKRKFLAVLLVLKNPGMLPYVEEGTARPVPLNERYGFGAGNWWCSSKKREVFSQLYAVSSQRLVFLTPEEQREVDEEWTALMKTPAAPNYLAMQVIEYGRTCQKDPQIPEALHLAVQATRYGCSDKDTTVVSKAAFTMLHKRYGKSLWARKTPYWF
ncbi:MAG: hypothetical protein V1736_06075 [Pseudomonadota bacterium]